MSKDKDPESNGLTNNGGSGGGGSDKLKVEMKVYHKPSSKELAAARPCRLFIVFTFVLFLVGFLIASIALLAISEKCNNRERGKLSVPSRMQYQIVVRSFRVPKNATNGNLRGVTSKLKYITSLGVDSILLNDVISENDFSLSADIGTEEDLTNLISGARESGLRVFLQMTPFVVSKSGRLFTECSRDISNCSSFVIREKTKVNKWKTAEGDPAWHKFESSSEFVYYSYYNDKLPMLNLRNEYVIDLIKKKLNWWFRFGIEGFVFPDVSRLIVEDFHGFTRQRDTDHPLSHLVLSTLYDHLDQLGGQLWVIPATSPHLMSTYLGTPSRPEAHLVINDVIAKQNKVNVYELNRTLSSVLHSNATTREEVGWMFGGPAYERLASRFSQSNQAEVMSLFQLTLPNQIVPFYGDEELLKGTTGSTTMFIDENKDTANNFTATDMTFRFKSLAKLRSQGGVFTGSSSIVYAIQGVLALVYTQPEKKTSTLVAVNFEGEGKTLSNVKGCRGRGRVLYTLNPVDMTVECKEIRLSSYDLLVLKLDD